MGIFKEHFCSYSRSLIRGDLSVFQPGLLALCFQLRASGS